MFGCVSDACEPLSNFEFEFLCFYIWFHSRKSWIVPLPSSQNLLLSNNLSGPLRCGLVPVCTCNPFSPPPPPKKRSDNHQTWFILSAQSLFGRPCVLWYWNDVSCNYGKEPLVCFQPMKLGSSICSCIPIIKSVTYPTSGRIWDTDDSYISSPKNYEDQ